MTPDDTSEPVFLMWCPCCRRKHRAWCQLCRCGCDYVVQPVSDKVADACGANYECERCLAYKEHLR